MAVESRASDIVIKQRQSQSQMGRASTRSCRYRPGACHWSLFTAGLLALFLLAPTSGSGEGLVVTEMGKLVPEATDNAYMRFGAVRALGGDTLVVGSPSDDGNGAGAGAVWILQRDHGGPDTWGLVSKIVAADGQAGDGFGSEVAIDGDTVVVGAPYDDDHGMSSGSVYLFERDHGGADAWGQTVKITAAAATEHQYFGSTLAIDGDTLVACSDPPGGDGVISIFYRNEGGSGSWGQHTRLVLPVEIGCCDISGDTVVVASFEHVYFLAPNHGGAWRVVSEVARPEWLLSFSSAMISGDTAAISYGMLDENGVFSDATWIHERHHGGQDAWGPVLQIDGDPSWEGYAYSSDMDGDTLLVTVDLEFGPQTAYLFARDQGGADQWGLLATISGHARVEDFSISGDTVVAGAPREDDNGAYAGAVYLYDRNQGGPNSWGQVARRPAPHSPSARNRQLGVAVAIDGDTMVAGAPRDEDNGYLTGSAFVYSLDPAATQPLEARLHGDGEATMFLGIKVAISGDTMVAGEQLYSMSSTAFVYSRGTEGWEKTIRLNSSEDKDLFGRSLAIDGDTIVVGARQDDDVASYAGAVHLFSRHQGGPDAWGQLTKLTAADGAMSDNFGYAVALDGDMLAVSAPGWGESGAVYLLRRTAETWSQVARLTPADGGEYTAYGHALAIGGDTVVVGAPNDDDGTVRDTGSVYVYRRDQGGQDAWGQVAKLTTDDGAIFDYFGSAVAVNDGVIAIGLPGWWYTGRNAVYLYSDQGVGSPTLLAKLSAPDTEIWNCFGYSIALDGHTMVVGAPADSSVGSSSGAVYYYAVHTELFSDTFESGDTGAWSVVVP